eukprot:Gb_13731 [translate_table: standard]
MATRKAMRLVIQIVGGVYTKNEYSTHGNFHYSIYELWYCQKRFLAKGVKVQRRSVSKREPDFEKVMERQKMLSKVLMVMEILKQEPEQVMTLKSLGGYRTQINLANDHRISVLLRKYPSIFEIYRDQRGVTWCGFTGQAEELIEEETKIKKQYESTTVNYVRRFLMMSVDKRLRVDKIAHFKRDMGLPDDFRKEWIYKFPAFFRVVEQDEIPYLELTSWDPSLAVTELEKKALNYTDKATGNSEASTAKESTSGLLYVPFPLKFPSNYRRVRKQYEATKRFQELPYLSPYEDPSGLKPGSKEFEKRAVAVMHEMLSFTLEKRLVTDHLTHFQREFRLPQKLMRLLLRHFGIFYVSEKGKRFNVFLTDAYEGSELIEKSPLVLWKDKVARLMGERRKRKKGKLDYNEDDGGEILNGDDYDKDLDKDGECLSGYDCDKDVEEEAEDDVDEEGTAEEDEMDVQEVIRVYES